MSYCTLAISNSVFRLLFKLASYGRLLVFFAGVADRIFDGSILSEFTSDPSKLVRSHRDPGAVDRFNVFFVTHTAKRATTTTTTSE